MDRLQLQNHFLLFVSGEKDVHVRQPSRRHDYHAAKWWIEYHTRRNVIGVLLNRHRVGTASMSISVVFDVGTWPARCSSIAHHRPLGHFREKPKELCDGGRAVVVVVVVRAIMVMVIVLMRLSFIGGKGQVKNRTV
ncbi:hypothetical protein D9758_014972 [Tetrapyrgos nigripes]|uniref:Uncharacterized protein n=1 Tax=Tetrapyrgos nigripes TaxID=182062 RepID=A0A8H5CLM6_9AGAR|nr:hypothetical protein D9758_014972 [Tetrapyrgos nigripes]